MTYTLLAGGDAAAVSGCARKRLGNARARALVHVTSLALFLVGSTVAATVSAAEALRVTGDTDPVKVYVLVTANDGAPIGGLTSGAFRISEDGASQATNSFTSSVTPTTTVFVMDYSSSMTNAGAIAPMEAGVKAYIDLMAPTDEAAVIKFNGDIGARVMQDLTSDKTALNTAVDTAPGGQFWTNLYDAINKGIDVLAQSANTTGSRVLVVLTDGSDNFSTTSLSTLAARLDAADVPVFTIGLGQDVDADLLQGLADNTGGKYAETDDADDLERIYGEISGRLNNEYLLTYHSAINDCNAHTLQVRVDTPEGEKTYSTTFARCFSTAPLPSTPTTGAAATGALLWELAGLLMLGMISGLALRTRGS